MQGFVATVAQRRLPRSNHSPLFYYGYHRGVLTTFRVPQGSTFTREKYFKNNICFVWMSSSYLPSDSTSMFLHRPSTITRWYAPWTGCWNISRADSTLLARNDSMFRRSHDLVMASETWSSLWNTSRALTAGFGGMRCGNFPSLNFCGFGRDWKMEKR